MTMTMASAGDEDDDGNEDDEGQALKRKSPPNRKQQTLPAVIASNNGNTRQTSNKLGAWYHKHWHGASACQTLSQRLSIQPALHDTVRTSPNLQREFRCCVLGSSATAGGTPVTHVGIEATKNKTQENNKRMFTRAVDDAESVYV